MAKSEHNKKPSLITRLVRGVAKRRAVLMTAAVVTVLSMSIYVGIDTWLTNQRLSVYGLQPPSTSGDGLMVQPDSVRQAQEGSDESTISNYAIENYIVSPDLPRVLTIDSIGVKARVLQMGVNPDGSIQAPKNIFDSGWYTGSAKPGEEGISLIDAHASGATRQGLFAYLDTLAVDDTVRIEKGDGTTLTYRVFKVETKDKNKIDMRDILKPKGNVTNGLTLITCTGAWLQDQNTYDKRAIVYTELVQ